VERIRKNYESMRIPAKKERHTLSLSIKEHLTKNPHTGGD
jgi:DNA-directed RNA polymerase subunit L